MAEKKAGDANKGRKTETRVFAKDAVNQTVTLPSAEKPAKPPKGKSQGTEKNISGPGSEKT